MKEKRKLQHLIDDFIEKTMLGFPQLSQLQLVVIDKENVFLRFIKVLAIHGNKGIGTGVMNELFTFCGQNKLSLWLDPGKYYTSNAVLRRWYLKLGFKYERNGIAEMVKRFE